MCMNICSGLYVDTYIFRNIYIYICVYIYEQGYALRNICLAVCVQEYMFRIISSGIC